jgi:hypothetical protein
MDKHCYTVCGSANMRRNKRLGRAGLLTWLVAWTGVLSAGCQISDSLADGLYGGVSDVVSSIISDAILGVLQAGG